MERIRELGRYQKGILLLLIVAFVLFTAVYSVLSSQVGIVYRDAFLQKSTEGESTLYSGKIKGKVAIFTVEEDKTVTYRYGNKTYGPYTARKDITAIPEDTNREGMIGVEIREGEEVFFRGGVWMIGNNDPRMMIYDENGMFYDGITFSSDGVMYDENGQVVDQNMPTVYTILQMMSQQELVKRVNWGAWGVGVFVSIVCALIILFAEELFRFSMAFRVDNVDGIYPSAGELVGRYISMTCLAAMALYVYFSGLIL